MKRSILMLEHDDDDRYITRAVFDENHYSVKLHFVDSSNDLFAFLISCERSFLPYPALILLNNDARPANAVEILRDLKGDQRYMQIPVVVLSGTSDTETVRKCYAAGANSFITKPSSGKETNDKIANLIRYWFQTVELPHA